MLEKKGVLLFKGVGLSLGAIIPFMIYFRIPMTRQMQLLIMVASLFLLFVLELFRKENQQVVLSLSGTMFGVLYIAWCMSFCMSIRNLEHGVFLVFYFL